MAIPTNKLELKEAIRVNYSRLNGDLRSISRELINLKELKGHQQNSQISIHNLVSYLLGWGELVLKWNLKKDKNLAVDFPETGFQWNELGKLANKFYDD